MLSKIPQVDFLCKVSTELQFNQSKMAKFNEKNTTTVQKHPVLTKFNNFNTSIRLENHNILWPHVNSDIAANENFPTEPFGFVV